MMTKKATSSSATCPERRSSLRYRRDKKDDRLEVLQHPRVAGRQPAYPEGAAVKIAQAPSQRVAKELSGRLGRALQVDHDRKMPADVFGQCLCPHNTLRASHVRDFEAFLSGKTSIRSRLRAGGKLGRSCGCPETAISGNGSNSLSPLFSTSTCRSFCLSLEITIFRYNRFHATNTVQKVRVLLLRCIHYKADLTILILIIVAVVKMRTITASFVAFIASAPLAIAGKQCFREPFPSMLAEHIMNDHRCGLYNPHVINWSCEPVRGVVPDAIWFEHQLALFENEDVEMPTLTMEGEEEEMPVYDFLGAKPSANPFPRVHNPWAGLEPTGIAAMAISALGYGSKAKKALLV